MYAHVTREQLVEAINLGMLKDCNTTYSHTILGTNDTTLLNTLMEVRGYSRVKSRTRRGHISWTFRASDIMEVYADMVKLGGPGSYAAHALIAEARAKQRDYLADIDIPVIKVPLPMMDRGGRSISLGGGAYKMPPQKKPGFFSRLFGWA